MQFPCLGQQTWIPGEWFIGALLLWGWLRRQGLLLPRPACCYRESLCQARLTLDVCMMNCANVLLIFLCFMVGDWPTHWIWENTRLVSGPWVTDGKPLHFNLEFSCILQLGMKIDGISFLILSPNLSLFDVYFCTGFVTLCYVSFLGGLLHLSFPIFVTKLWLWCSL